MTRGSVIVVPHFDDEILQAGAFLVSYPHPILVIFTHHDDLLDYNSVVEQKEMFQNSASRIAAYRQTKNMAGILYNAPITTDIVDMQKRRLCLLHLIEAALRSFDVVDYFISSLRTGHQSHTESSEICLSALRHDMLDRTRNVLQAPYPALVFGCSSHSIDDTYYTSFRPIPEDGMEHLIDCIACDYVAKCWTGSTADADAFRTECEFYGKKAGVSYAMPFSSRKIILLEGEV